MLKLNLKNMNFDAAIELLEITEISIVTTDSLQKIGKRAKKRWHPDNVIFLKNDKLTQEYSEKFQKIEFAVIIVEQYLKGELEFGEPITNKNDASFQEKNTVDIIRENAPEIQSEINDYFSKAKNQNIRISKKMVELSDGFSLADLIQEDYDDEMASKAYISFTYGLLIVLIFSIILGLINESLLFIPISYLIIHSIACFLMALPLSRFWMNSKLVDVSLFFVNLGLSLERALFNPYKPINKGINLFVVGPRIIAKIIKYIIVLPMTIIGKAIVGKKRVGIVKEEVTYYSGVAEWYLHNLIQKKPNELNEEELFNLSYVLEELKKS